MAINFPISPTNGQSYTGPDGTVWSWDGSKWVSGVQGSGAYAPLISPVFTGDPRGPTPATADNDTSLATTAYVKAQGYAVASSYLPLTGGSLTGALAINTNAAALPAVPAVYNVQARLASPDAANTTFVSDAFGAANIMLFRQAGGTAAAPAATASGNILATFQTIGHDGTAYGTTSRGLISIQAPATWTPTSNPTQIAFSTTAPASTSATTRMYVTEGVSVGATGADMGGGTVYALNGFYTGGTITAGQARVANQGQSYADWVGTTNGISFNSYISGGQYCYAFANTAVSIRAVYPAGGFTITGYPTGTAGAVLPGGSNLMNITANGDFSIFSANAYKPSGGTWTAPSDRSLKAMTAEWNTGLAAVLALRPLNYRYNDDNWNLPETDFVGLDAEDAAAVIPEMARTYSHQLDPKQPAQEYGAVDSGPLIYALVNAVKELAAKVALLEQDKPQ
jgi:hypothetical protein